MSHQSNSLSVLLVEDQVSIAHNIAEFMEQKGHIFDFATKGKQALELALTNHYDLVILDLNLPEMDGLEICLHLREKSDRHIPILMLTARDSLDDKISGFGAGADDYLTKPFLLQELELRCLALSRRHLIQASKTLSLGPLSIDRKRKRVLRDNSEINLHTMGYRILTILAESYPLVVSRSQLSQKLWGDDPTESDSLRSHIYQLRNLLDKPFKYPLLKTVHGVGFVLDIKNDQ